VRFWMLASLRSDLLDVRPARTRGNRRQNRRTSFPKCVGIHQASRSRTRPAQGRRCGRRAGGAQARDHGCVVGAVGHLRRLEEEVAGAHSASIAPRKALFTATPPPSNRLFTPVLATGSIVFRSATPSLKTRRDPRARASPESPLRCRSCEPLGNAPRRTRTFDPLIKNLPAPSSARPPFSVKQPLPDRRFAARPAASHPSPTGSVPSRRSSSGPATDSASRVDTFLALSAVFEGLRSYGNDT